MREIEFEGTTHEKACPRCEIVRPIDQFYRDRSRRSGHTPVCKACWPAAKRKPGRNKQYNRTARNKVLSYVRGLKEVPCVDCGVRYPYYVMDFDHVNGEKAFCIGHANGKHYGLSRIKLEAAKCDVVCSNCHRERTYTRTHA